jgi:hypothetical protein
MTARNQNSGPSESKHGFVGSLRQRQHLPSWDNFGAFHVPSLGNQPTKEIGSIQLVGIHRNCEHARVRRKGRHPEVDVRQVFAFGRLDGAFSKDILEAPRKGTVLTIHP